MAIVWFGLSAICALLSLLISPALAPKQTPASGPLVVRAAEPPPTPEVVAVKNTPIPATPPEEVSIQPVHGTASMIPIDATGRRWSVTLVDNEWYETGIPFIASQLLTLEIWNFNSVSGYPGKGEWIAEAKLHVDSVVRLWDPIWHGDLEQMPRGMLKTIKVRMTQPPKTYVEYRIILTSPKLPQPEVADQAKSITDALLEKAESGAIPLAKWIP